MNGLNFENGSGPLTQRTKLVKIQDSLVCPSEEEIEANVDKRDVRVNFSLI